MKRETKDGKPLERFVNYGSESDVQGHVKAYLLESLQALKLEAILSVFNEFYIAKHRPDILIIFNKKHIPCGVVEVKKPLEH